MVEFQDWVELDRIGWMGVEVFDDKNQNEWMTDPKGQMINLLIISSNASNAISLFSQ
jgi:hypothetical protein